jgi:HK97 family phage major capsid protein
MFKQTIGEMLFAYMKLMGFVLFDSDADIKALVEKGLGEVKTKLETSIEKFEGQLKDKDKVDNETREEVKSLAEEFAKINTAVTEIGQKMADGFKNAEASKIVTPGQEFVITDDFKNFTTANNRNALIRLQIKNTVTGGSTTVFPQQNGGVISGNFAPLTVRAILPSAQTGSNQVNSLREASWNNSAAGVSEGNAKPESDITFEQYNVSITTIAHWIKVSNQLLADAPAIASYIDVRLRDGLAQEFERQLVKGSGIAPEMSGLTDSGNYTAYSPTSDDLLVDAINRAKYSLWAATGFAPDAVIVNPADWGAMERTREGAGTGMYLYGMPGVAAGVNPFGVRIVLSNNVAAGSFIIGAFNAATMLYNRQGAVVEMGYVNDDFTKNLVTIRAEERAGLAVERPSLVYFGSFSA